MYELFFTHQTHQTYSSAFSVFSVEISNSTKYFQDSILPLLKVWYYFSLLCYRYILLSTYEYVLSTCFHKDCFIGFGAWLLQQQWNNTEESVNSAPAGQNSRHFADAVFICIFVNEKFCILILISLKFVLEGPIVNNPALV